MKFSAESLERLVIAVQKLETEAGLKVHVPLVLALGDDIYQQLPEPLRQTFSSAGSCNV